jgi:tetratricopeptide (TPR) repeat protein/predicted Ser/Thr protein kinase
MLKKKIAHYEIGDILGEGGMGSVYKATDLEADRTVALKVLSRRSLADDEIKRRFMREANAGAHLDHPGIVKIYDFGEEEGEHYLAMEYVEGETLRHLVKDSPLLPEQAVDICIAVAEALAAAHKAGVLHRDIKSENIMLTPVGEVKVMDFGLARMQNSSLLTQEGGLLGTVAYMSPQQASGEAVDHRSDIFSLGVVLYELLTGRLPFGAEYEMAVIYSILNEDPIGVKDLNPQLPEALDQVIVKALRKELNNRYQSGDEFAADLKKVKEILQSGTDAEAADVELIAAVDKEKREVRVFQAGLVGREKEFETLKKLLVLTGESEGQTVLIAGEAGIGKSRLVAELQKYARNKKITMLTGRCLFKQGTQPYQPFIEAIGSYFDIKGIGSDDHLREFINEKAPDLLHLLPIYRMFLNIKDQEEVSLENKEQLWDAIYKLIVKISFERPIIIYLDDIHWADEDTLNLFYYTSRNTTSEKVMFVGTYRTEDVLVTAEGKEHPMLEIQRQMNREGELTVIKLTRLTAGHIRAMVESLFPDSGFGESFYEMVFTETEGNPFFAMELIKLFKSEGIIEKVNGTFRLREDYDRIVIPSKIHDIVMMRIGRLNDEERELLEVGAVEGDAFHSDTIASCLDLRRIHVLRKLQALERDHHIIHPQDKMYRFDHGKIREILYDSILPELRTEYHLMIGDTLVKTYEGQDYMAANIAHHYEQGNDHTKALRYLITAAERARIFFANDQALELYGKALGIITEFEQSERDREHAKGKDIVLEGMGDVFLLIGKHDEAFEHYHDLIDNADIPKTRRSDVLRKLGIVYTNKGETEKALEILNEAEKAFDGTSDEEDTRKIIGRIQFTRARILKSQGYYEAARKDIDEGIRLLGDEGYYIERAEAYNNLGNILYDQGEFDRALETYTRSLKLRDEVGDQKGVADAYINLGNVHYELGNYNSSVEMTEKGLEIRRKIGFKAGIAAGYNNLGTIYQDMGKYDEAREMYEKSLEIHSAIDDVPRIALTFANLGSVNLDLGEYETAAMQLETSLTMQREMKIRDFLAQTIIWYAEALFKQDKFDEARQVAAEAVSEAQETRQRGNEGKAKRILAMINIEHILKETSQPEFEIETLRHLTESLEILESLKMEHEIGRTCVELARFYFSAGDPDQGKHFIERARNIFERLGAESDNKNAELIETQFENLSE